MYVRIRKQHARKLYNADVPITMVGHKMQPFRGWNLGYTIHKSKDMESYYATCNEVNFDRRVNAHAFYNTSWEEGYYAAFYVKQSDATQHNIPIMGAY